VIEDILEFGNVQRGILGIQGGNLNSKVANQLGIDETEGVYVNGIEKGSGAERSGIKKGDIIKEVDGFKISKFSDLVGYLGSKQPNDVVIVTLHRNGHEKTVPVTLKKIESIEILDLGLEVSNSSSTELQERGLTYGVKVTRIINNDMTRYNLIGVMILKLNDRKVRNIDDVRKVLQDRSSGEPIKMTFADEEGNLSTYIFR
jgi:Trypsin-like serine proteases, typically periplasmic, contain C-terminal PDZ domain